MHAKKLRTILIWVIKKGSRRKFLASEVSSGRNICPKWDEIVWKLIFRTFWQVMCYAFVCWSCPGTNYVIGCFFKTTDSTSSKRRNNHWIRYTVETAVDLCHQNGIFTVHWNEKVGERRDSHLRSQGKSCIWRLNFEDRIVCFSLECRKKLEFCFCVTTLCDLFSESLVTFSCNKK